jgi:hypothetical protein
MLHEHDLAREEVLEGMRNILEGFALCSCGSSMFRSHAGTGTFEGAAIDRFHDSRTAAGDHGEAASERRHAMSSALL